MPMIAREANDPTDKIVLITAGDFAGQRGFCLGPSNRDGLYAITPDASNRIFQLKINVEFVVAGDVDRGNSQ